MLLLETKEIKIDRHFQYLDSIKLLHFSDLHLISPSKTFDNWFKYLRTIESDVVIVSGDLIDHDRGIDVCVEYLSMLKPRYGTFVAYGNHDKYQLGLKELIFFVSLKKFRPNNLSLLRAKLENKGIKVLDNKIATLDINGATIKMVGIDCPLGYDRIHNPQRFREEILKIRALVNQSRDNNYSILISHVPDLIKELDTSHINLILSSHTHGGQIRLPFLGPLIAMSSFQRKYNRGLYRYNGSYLHVSPGLGVSATTPFRLGCSSTATLLVLKI